MAASPPPSAIPGLSTGHIFAIPTVPPTTKKNPVQTRFDKTPPSLHRAPGGQTAIRLNKSQVE